MRRGPNARGRRTVAAIEKAALDAGEELPWTSATVAEICARAGVSERVFFNHFRTREDAFIGTDRPTLDDGAAARYISDPRVPLITGAAHLVKLPPVDPNTQRRRIALIAAHPALLAREYSVLVPLRERCREIVAAAIANRDPGLSEGERHTLAAVIVGAASELVADPEGMAPASAALRRLREHLH